MNKFIVEFKENDTWKKCDEFNFQVSAEKFAALYFRNSGKPHRVVEYVAAGVIWSTENE